MKKFICLATALMIVCSISGCKKDISDISSGSQSFYEISSVTEETPAATTSSGASSKTTVSSQKVPSSNPVQSENPVSSSAAVSSKIQNPFVPPANITYWCFEHLNAEQQRIYGIINNAIKTMQSGMVNVGECTSADMAIAFRAVETDHPEYFWVPYEYVSEIRKNTRYIAFDFSSSSHSVSYNCSKSERDSMQKKLDAEIEKVKALVPSGTSDYEIELIIHDYICEKSVYNKTGNSSYTAYGALVDGNAVCEGYSRAMQLLCNEFRIPCTLISGTADGTGHMWNQIKIGGDWYHLDVTWDDMKTNSGFHGFFNVSDSYILSSHTISKSFEEMSESDLLEGNSCNISRPACVSIKYWFATVDGCALTTDAASAESIITEKLRQAADSGKNSCEFSFTADSGITNVTTDYLYSNFALQKCISDVNYKRIRKIRNDVIRLASMGKAFILLFSYEGE